MLIEEILHHHWLKPCKKWDDFSQSSYQLNQPVSMVGGFLKPPSGLGFKNNAPTVCLGISWCHCPFMSGEIFHKSTIFATINISIHLKTRQISHFAGGKTKKEGHLAASRESTFHHCTIWLCRKESYQMQILCIC